MSDPVSGGFDVTGFRNAAPYINQHRDHTFVISFGGEAVADAAFADLINDIALLYSLGVKLVLVHGARPQIERLLKRDGERSRYHDGLRVTDDRALAAVKQAVGSLRVEIEARLSMGLYNTPMAGMRINVASGNFITARPLGVRDGVDFLHTGEVRKVDAHAIRQLLAQGSIVMLSPLGYSPTGETFNISAEDVAATTASALQTDKLVFLIEGEPLRDGKKRLLRQLNLGEAQALLTGKRKLSRAQRRHLEYAVNAGLSNVRRVHMLDRRVDGALLKEFYTRDGAGTLVTVAHEYEGVRDATVDDVGGILALIEPLEDSGALVRRSREQIELEIPHFCVAERDGTIIACAALMPFIDEKVGEVACLATHPDYQASGRATALLEHIIVKGKEFGIERLFVLTTRTAHWFVERGFSKGNLKELPVRRRELYNYQRNSKVFVKPL